MQNRNTHSCINHETIVWTKHDYIWRPESASFGACTAQGNRRNTWDKHRKTWNACFWSKVFQLIHSLWTKDGWILRRTQKVQSDGAIFFKPNTLHKFSLRGSFFIPAPKLAETPKFLRTKVTIVKCQAALVTLQTGGLTVSWVAEHETRRSTRVLATSVQSYSFKSTASGIHKSSSVIPVAPCFAGGIPITVSSFYPLQLSKPFFLLMT